jgi:hypothetical protein
MLLMIWQCLSLRRKHWWRWIYGVSQANGELILIDYREAPLAASKTCFLDDKGNVIPGKVHKQH